MFLVFVKFMTTLDKPELIKALDKSNLAGFISELPVQISSSLKKIEKISLPPSWKQVKNICLCGMGGSALANHLITNLPLRDKRIPMKVVRDYSIPAWVNKESLVILTSHSGQTQETISAFKCAAEQEAKIFIIAERRELEKLGAKEAAIVFDYDTQAPPRASLGYQFGAVFGLLNKLKIINYEIHPALGLLKRLNKELVPEVETENNLAKNLSYCCFDRLPIIVASGILKSVAWRWKTQFNENAKKFTFVEFLPEAMHNAIQGFEFPARFADDLIYLILQNSFDPPELVSQFNKFKNILDEKKIRYEIIESAGESIFSQKLSLLLLGDWVSFYLAMLNNTDPTPVEVIEKVKK